MRIGALQSRALQCVLYRRGVPALSQRRAPYKFESSEAAITKHHSKRQQTCKKPSFAPVRLLLARSTSPSNACTEAYLAAAQQTLLGNAECEGMEPMKRAILVVACLALALTAFAKDNKGEDGKHDDKYHDWDILDWIRFFPKWKDYDLGHPKDNRDYKPRETYIDLVDGIPASAIAKFDYENFIPLSSFTSFGFHEPGRRRLLQDDTSTPASLLTDPSAFALNSSSYAAHVGQALADALNGDTNTTRRLLGQKWRDYIEFPFSVKKSAVSEGFTTFVFDFSGEDMTHLLKYGRKLGHELGGPFSFSNAHIIVYTDENDGWGDILDIISFEFFLEKDKGRIVKAAYQTNLSKIKNTGLALLGEVTIIIPTREGPVFLTEYVLYPFIEVKPVKDGLPTLDGILNTLN